MEDEKQTPYDTPYQPPLENPTPPPPPIPPNPVSNPATAQSPFMSNPAPTESPTPAAIQTPTSSDPSQRTSPGNIVLQWLTYAFWGWTILATSILTATVISSFVGDSNPGDFTAYAVAAVLVLLPISIVCDLIYSKQEPEHKHGAASIVMVIHAVIFALLGVGAIISVVFSIVSMFISSGDKTDSQIFLYSSLIIAFLYASVIVRTVFPTKFPWIRRAFVLEMVVVVGIVALLGVIGPIAKARVTRTDTLIENNLSTLQYAIEDYAKDNDELPENLNDVSVQGDAKKLVDDNLVDYKANTKNSTTEIDKYGTTYNDTYDSNSYKTYYYQLCVDYKASKKDRYSTSSSSYDSTDGYSSYITTYGHPEGEVCYKLKTLGY